MAETAKKYCEDCKFVQFANQPGKAPDMSDMLYARCGAPGAISPLHDVYVARALDKPRYCSATRADKEQCGTEAKWFEAKELEMGVRDVGAD